MRFHFWVLIRTEGRPIDEVTFVEPSTGTAHPIDSPFYSGIESVWNHLNYWVRTKVASEISSHRQKCQMPVLFQVNMQDCKEGLGKIDYNLHDVEKWEHLLIGEPTQWRETKLNLNMDDDEIALAKIMEEKHLDMPISWSMKIHIPHKGRYDQMEDLHCAVIGCFSSQAEVPRWDEHDLVQKDAGGGVCFLRAVRRFGHQDNEVQGF